MAFNGVNVNNLAAKYSKKVDERFHKESQAMLALNNDYEFTGVKTVNVYSIPTAALGDYNRGASGSGLDPLHRYGTPSDLTLQVQSLTLTQDKAFTFVIDKGDKDESEMVLDVGKALARQIREVMVPFYDTYVFNKMASVASSNGATSATTITASNAYSELLKAQEVLGNALVPDKGRVCFCSYAFANFLKQDSAFMRYGDTTQDMLIKGIMGEVDGTKIVKVPASRLPAGCDFILAHPCATTAPKVLEEYKTHADPPGISGWLCEGRFIFDAFVLNQKKAALYHHGTAI